ncbi:MAG: DUF2760 domain-containing protein [Bryobacteraceae bacterium]
MSRISLAFKSFFSLLFGGQLPEDVLAALNLTRRLMTAPAAAKPEAAKTEPAKPVAQPADGAVQLLGLLQREARLVDFLLEDISSYSDDQVGAAVRDVHKNCRTVLDRHLKLAPVVDGVEGAVTKVSSLGINAKDQNLLKIVGKVPPDGKVDAGVLRHRGWRVEKVDLPGVKPGERVVTSAELEVE